MDIRLSVPAERERLDDLTAAIAAVMERHAIAQPVIDDVVLIAEEVVCNTADYGFDAGQEREIVVAIRAAEAALHVQFRDNGRPFDPLSQPSPDLDAGIDERPVGGLGVHLVRQLARRVDYVRDGAYNVLDVTLDLTPSETGDAP